MTDVFLYNGDLERGSDLEFIKLVHAEKSSEDCLLVLVTGGGSPDAAYKIARYLQNRYSSFKVLISGWCKSAGTLLAIGAEELIFTPYGELGPLDVQMVKADKLTGMESGLNISEAFRALEQRAHLTYHKLLNEILSSTSGVVTFQTASHAATELINAMYAPIFSRIDPEEVGSRSRAMRIGEDYGKRLNEKWQNLKPDSLRRLSQTYSSHGFVIDRMEASALFQRVRGTTQHEMELVEGLGPAARHPLASLKIEKLAFIEAANDEDHDHAQALQDEVADGGVGEGPAEGDGTHPGAAVGT